MKKYKYQFLLLFGLLIGVVILQFVVSEHYQSEDKKRLADLKKRHEETIIKMEAGIEVYASVVSSIRAFIENSPEFPSEIRLQKFLYDLTRETNFKDSIIVSWVDTNQVFQYVTTPYEIDPGGLKGESVKRLRPEFEIQKLDALMLEDSIKLFVPINLYEGWAAFPFNFSARNSKGEILGYMAVVLNVKYLLDYPYRKGDKRFYHSFTTANNVDITREAVFDGTKIYNKHKDPEYYKNIPQTETTFLYTKLNFYGLELILGTAYKELQKTDSTLVVIIYLWYGTLCLFSLIFLSQFIRNNRLNKRIILAHQEISTKNQQLQNNYSAIQVLAKEVHHRVKNNMQIMSSLMNLQSGTLDDEKFKAVFEESIARMQSMALIHQKLYGNAELTNVNIKQYVEELIDHIEVIMSSKEERPNKLLAIPSDITLNMNLMISLGLILNELITNSYKYAFNNSEEKWIKISLKKESNKIEIIYSDSGPGIPEYINPQESESLGLELIHVLTDQLEGEVHYDNSNGSTFTINFNEITRN